MRLTSLAAEGLLSFERLELTVEQGLSVIVGPNGSGKTNLGRLVRLAAAAVQAAAVGDAGRLERQWRLAGRYGNLSFEARVGLAFEDDAEQLLVEDWSRAALPASLQLSNVDALARLDGLFPQSLRAGDLLARGELIVRRDPRLNQPWIVSWQTQDPVGHLDLLRGGGFTPGPLPADVGWESSRSRLYELLRGPDGQAIPPLTDSSAQEEWERCGAAMAGFKMADLVAARAPIELVARRNNADPQPASVRRLAELFPALNNPQQQISFAHVLDRLLSSLVVTENSRVPMQTEVEAENLSRVPRIEDGSGLAVQLLQLKNGDAEFRARFHALQGVFEEITDRRIDVRQTFADHSSQTLVTPVVVEKHPDTGREADIPLESAGAGVEESAWLASLLTNDCQTLVLDEPASNLSAVAQRRLLRVIREQRRDKQTIIITHSADLVPVHDAADFGVITRLSRRGGATVPHRPHIGQHEFEAFKELLRQSQLRALLFTAGVVLVEGPTEVEAFETWLARADDHELPTPESSHIVFLSVGGDERFRKHAQLMELLSVPYAIVADGPAFAPGGALSKLPRQAPLPADPLTEGFAEAASSWESHGVFTLASEFGTGDRKGCGEIEAFFEAIDASLWATLCDEPGRKDKALLGYRFATRTAPPGQVLDLWRKLLGVLLRA